MNRGVQRRNENFVRPDSVSLSSLVSCFSKIVVTGELSHVSVLQKNRTRFRPSVVCKERLFFLTLFFSFFSSSPFPQHEVLSYIAKGSYVILLNHTNSERGYLKARLQPRLEKELKELGVDCEVKVSKTDKDPLVVE